MQSKFLETFSGKLAESWFTTLLTPAFTFWIGGLGIVIYKMGWQKFQNCFQPFLKQIPETMQITLLVGGLLIVTISAFVIQRFDLTILKFLEGYWPSGMSQLRKLMVRQQKQLWKNAKEKRKNIRIQLDGLEKKLQESSGTRELDEDNYFSLQEQFVQLDLQLMHFPTSSNLIMPTKLGNILRSSEMYSSNRYGIDAVICWPRIWLILPDNVKQELQEARANLNASARNLIWSILFLICWTPFAYWAAIIGLLAIRINYVWLIDAAIIYADLIRSVFDLHRQDLYKSLRLPQPNDPNEEKKLGKQLTQYLWRGSIPPDLKNYH